MNDRPIFIALAAQSADGFIARSNDELINWSSKEDKKMFAGETKQAGVVIVGSNTFRTFPGPLWNRLNLVLTSKPEQFKPIPGLAEFVDASPAQVSAELARRGLQKAFVIGGSYTYTEFLTHHLLDELWITVEPVVFGKGLPIFDRTVYDVNCSLTEVIRLNEQSVHLRYKLAYE